MFISRLARRGSYAFFNRWRSWVLCRKAKIDKAASSSMPPLLIAKEVSGFYKKKQRLEF